MIEQMTYQQMIEAKRVTFPETVDEPLQQTIYDWFQFRPVADNDRFNVFFNRVLNRDIRQFNELLRIEPGVSNYDWLVQKYKERQVKKENENQTQTTKGSETSVRTPDLYQYDVTKIQTSTISNGLESKTGADSITKLGDEKRRIEKGTETEDRTSNDGINKSSRDFTKGSETTDTTTDVGAQNNSSSTNYGKQTTTASPHVGKKTTNGGDVSAWSGDSQIQAQLPMSETYGSKDIIEPDSAESSANTDKQYYEHAYQHMPSLDWHTASAQSQNGHREYSKDARSVTESYVYGDGVKGDITTSDARTDQTTEEKGKRQDKQNVVESERIDNEAITNEQTKDATENVSRTYDPSTDTLSYVDRKDTTNYGSSLNTTDSTTKNVDAPHTHGTDTTEKTFGPGTTTGTNKDTVREISTGRYDTPARILSEASNFIKQSSAWSWLEERLEPCFLGIYEI